MTECSGYVTDSIPIYPYTQPNSVCAPYITSPSGVYVAYLLPTVQFEVQRGSTPNPPPSGTNGVWATPQLNIGTPQYASANLFPTGEFDLYGNSNSPAYTVSPSSGDRSGATLSLSDSGTLTINQGRSPGPLGAQYFSNNISDPVTSIALSDINYDLAHPTNTKITQVSAASNLLKNNTAQTQSIATSLSLAYTKTSSWNFGLSEAIAIGLKSTSSVGVPGVGQELLELSLTSTTTISSGTGQSDTFNTGFSTGIPASVPPFSTYQTKLSGMAETFDVPYTWDGVATYSTGATADIHGSGVFSGGDTGVFTTEVDCIQTPGGCPTGPVSEELVGGGGLGSGVPVGVPSPIPEPASLPLLPAALMATVVIRRLRTRPGRRAGPARGMALRGAREQAGLAG